MSRHDRAERLALSCLPTLARHGRHNAVDWVSRAFDSLAHLGQPEPYLHDGPDATKALEADLETLIANFRGGSVQFASNVVYDPATGEGGWPVDTAAPTPWAAVTDRGRALARDSYATTLAQRLALTKPPVRIPAPGGSLERTACGMCGIGAGELSALRVLRAGGVRAAESQVWDRLNVAPSSLGARSRSGVSSRELPICRACRAAVDEAGGTGTKAIERAILAHLKASGTEVSEVRNAILDPDREVTGLRGWVALALDERDRTGSMRRPNSEPWSHIDLTRLASRPMVSDPAWAMPEGAV